MFEMFHSGGSAAFHKRAATLRQRGFRALSVIATGHFEGGRGDRGGGRGRLTPLSGFYDDSD